MQEYEIFVQLAQSPEDAGMRHDAFNELVRAFQGMAFHHAYATLGDVQLAEDATQDAFITAYMQIHQLREPAAFPGWLRRIVWTQCDRQTRRTTPQMVPIDTQYDLETNLDSPESAYEEQELIDRVQAAIQALPEHERDVTEGFYLNGESQKEIAERLSVPVTTVKKRLQYARQRLRVIISDFNDTLDRMLAPQQQPKLQPQPIYVRNEPALLPPPQDTEW